jgi:hypothetical protein
MPGTGSLCAGWLPPGPCFTGLTPAWRPSLDRRGVSGAILAAAVFGIGDTAAPLVRRTACSQGFSPVARSVMEWHVFGGSNWIYVPIHSAELFDFRGAKRSQPLQTPGAGNDVQPHSRWSAADRATVSDAQRCADRDWGSMVADLDPAVPTGSDHFSNTCTPSGEPNCS